MTSMCLLLTGWVGTANAVLVNGKDWLDIRTTLNYSWAQFDAILDDAGQCIGDCLLVGGNVNDPWGARALLIVFLQLKR